MKKVLIIASDDLSKSGVPNVFTGIINNLHKKGFVFDVVYFYKNDNYYENEIVKLGGKAIYCPIDEMKKNKIGKLKVKFRYFREAKKIIKDYGPFDVVHSFKGFESGYFLKAAKKLRVKTRIAHMCFFYNEPSSFLIKQIENKEIKITKKYSTQIIADSYRTLNNNVPGCEKGTVVRAYYDDLKFKYNELETSARPISLIQIGSYCHNKNQLFSLEVFKNILSKYPESKLNYVGFRNNDDFSYLDTLKEKIKEYDLESNVIFHEFNANIPELFKTCNYLLFPSHYESFGVVVVEAQSSGLTCFCSDTISKEGDCGGCHYLSINVPSFWSKKIIEDYCKSGGLHKRFNVDEFSSEKITSDLLKIYNGNK